MLAALAGLPAAGAAQDTGLGLGAFAVPAFVYADPVAGGNTLAEARVLHPLLMAHASAAGGRLRLLGTLDFEGLTLEQGELSPGAWGEGFVDRRHPHTYVHELMLTGEQPLGPPDTPWRVSLSAGKGFAPFGTDDPMSRPPLRYPVNHHLSQILERALLMGAVRRGPVALEAALFNGDEPERPGQWPAMHRFGDAWSARVTVWPVDGLELQASYADVPSPEHRDGAGLEHRKVSVSGRWQRPLGGRPVYALVEWSRDREGGGVFVYGSILGESAIDLGRHRLLYRLERTERPEEERSISPFRSRRPHLENAVLGKTRWTIHTAGYAFDLTGPGATVRAQPQLEISYGSIAKIGGGLFDVESFYGRSSFWSLTVGVRLGVGDRMHRMGRYGVTESPAPAHVDHTDTSER